MHNGYGRTVLTLVAVAAILTGCKEEEVARDIPPRPIRSFTVSEVAGTMARQFTGVMEPAESAALSFSVPGSVIEIPVGPGMSVEAGEVIAKLDPEPFELEIAGAQNELDRLTADLEAKQAELARSEQLFEKAWIAEAAIEKQRAAVQTAESAVGYARSRVALAERNLANAVLTAPYAGEIASRHVDAFEEIAPGQPIVDLNSNAGLVASFSVPEVGIGRIASGQEVDLTFAALPGIHARARITEIEAAATTGNAFTVKASLAAPVEGLRPGMTVTVATRADAAVGTEGYFVPLNAIAPAEGNFAGSVFRFDPAEGVVHQVPVRIAGVRDNLVIVTDGLEPGEVVASAGVSFLVDGQPVRLLEE